MKQIHNQWIVNAAEAKQLIEQGATVLDVRNMVVWALGHVKGAVRVTWQQFSQQKSPFKGKLIENLGVMEQKLCEVGVFNGKPVIVVGNSVHGFGEEGRIVWMLRTLGHPQAAFVDGGHNALVQVGVSIERGVRSSAGLERGDFVVKRSHLWEIDRDELKAKLAATASPSLIALDTREPREYAGGTPYGERRGGHIPGAVNLYFKDLMDERGNLLPRGEIVAKLNRLGIARDTPIAAYCTGGIRSAFVVAVLADLNFNNVKNYSGSMWDWSAFDAASYPLE